MSKLYQGKSIEVIQDVLLKHPPCNEIREHGSTESPYKSIPV